MVASAPEDMYGLTGDTVTLLCHFTSTLPINITWTKQVLPSLQIIAITMDNRITINSNGSSGKLVIEDTISDDSGLYRCTGVTVAGTAVTAAEIIIGSKSTIVVSRLGEPLRQVRSG